MITIQGSYAGIETVRNLSLLQRSLTRSMQKLASGQQINTAADGPAELVISEKMRAQIGTLTEQVRGLEFRLNRNQAADAAVGELQSKLGELRDLAIAASDEVANTPDVSKVFQQQFDDLVNSYNEQRNGAEYSGFKLLDGSEGAVTNVRQMPSMEVGTPADANRAMIEVDLIMRKVEESRQEIGARQQLEYESTMRSLEVASQNLTAAEASIRDTDYAGEQAQLLRQLVQTNVSVAAMAQGQMNSDTVFKLLHA